MSSWIKSEYWFSEQAVLLTIGERDARVVCGILVEHQDDPEAMRTMLTDLVNRCRPDLFGHTMWFMRFSPEKRAWEMYVNHPSLPRKKFYEQSTSQLLRLDDALPWTAPTKVVADVPLIPKEAKDFKEIVDTTLQNYIKAGDSGKALLPKNGKVMQADEPFTVS